MQKETNVIGARRLRRRWFASAIVIPFTAALMLSIGASDATARPPGAVVCVSYPCISIPPPIDHPLPPPNPPKPPKPPINTRA